jgi:signal peptidase I
MVFRYPEDPSLDYIKRVVGLPGDTVAYQNKRLTINGQAVRPGKMPITCIRSVCTTPSNISEKLGDVEHRCCNDTDAPAFIPDASRFLTGKIAPTMPPAYLQGATRALFHDG